MFGRGRRARAGVSEEQERQARGRSSRSKAYGNRRERDFEDISDATADYLRTFANLARGQAQYFADHYKHRAADVIDDFASSLRETGWRQEKSAGSSEIVHDIADGLEDLSDTIRDIRLSSALAEVENTIRRRPVASALTATAVGLLAVHLLSKKSSRNPDASSGGRDER